MSSRQSQLAWGSDGDMSSGTQAVLYRLGRISWLYVGLISLVASVGFVLLYSAADGNFSAYASPQMKRFGFGLILMISIAVIDIKWLMRLAYPAWLGAMALLVWVEVAGQIGMGAQRWIALGPLNLQPSEIMKLALVLALARYFHSLPLDYRKRWTMVIVPLFLAGAPTVLVLMQPDLGTSILIVGSGAAVMILAGAPLRLFVGAAALAGAAAPFAWNYLHDYQQQRVLTFLDPSRDPLGAGYHITQSKIALGSGGVAGRGFMDGTQSHLSFLPETQTDFVFTVLAEEFGLMGGLFLLGLYALLLFGGWLMANNAKSDFGRLLAGGMVVVFSTYIIVNVAMVIGLMPVVGVPLPLISYGGTAMLTVMIAFGLLMNVHVHRDVKLSRNEGVII